MFIKLWYDWKSDNLFLYSNQCVLFQGLHTYMSSCYASFSAVQCPKSISNGQLSDSCSLDFGAACTSANCSYGYESSTPFSISCTGARTWDADTTILCSGLYMKPFLNSYSNIDKTNAIKSCGTLVQV